MKHQPERPSDDEVAVWSVLSHLGDRISHLGRDSAPQDVTRERLLDTAL